MLFFKVTVVWSAICHCSLCSQNNELTHALHCLNHGTVFCLIGVISLCLLMETFLEFWACANSRDYLDCSLCFWIILQYWQNLISGRKFLSISISYYNFCLCKFSWSVGLQIFYLWFKLLHCQTYLCCKKYQRNQFCFNNESLLSRSIAALFWIWLIYSCIVLNIAAGCKPGYNIFMLAWFYVTAFLVMYVAACYDFTFTVLAIQPSDNQHNMQAYNTKQILFLSNML